MKVIKRDPNKGYLDRWLWVPKSIIDANSVKGALTYELSSSFGRGRTQLLFLWKETAHHLLLPRAFWDVSKLPCVVVDCRPQSYERIDFVSRIRLDHKVATVGGKKSLVPTGEDLQRRSIAAMETSPSGTIQLACGKGKSVIALEHIARSKVPALVMLDNTNLLYQWLKLAEELLEVPGGIGVFGDGQRDWKKGLVLATYHSIANWSDTIPEEAREWFGGIYWDEGHHCFPPDALVDGVRIEGIEVGTLVHAYNHDTKCVELRRVTHKHVSQVHALVRVRLTNGKEHVSTPEHPFFTHRGYVAAKDLLESDALAARGQENGVLSFHGVESVEVLEPGGDGTFGGVCPEGLVYNLEVEGLSNYFIEGTLVHNCPAPMFSKTADMFYGKRYSLTATPERDDGLHVLSDGHIGPVIIKDLTPTMKPSFAFIWTGVGIDIRNPLIRAKVTDVNGEIHFSKLSPFFGEWVPRIDLITYIAQECMAQNRVLLVLANSVDEVVNLMNRWERPGHPAYSDIPVPTPFDVGETLPPAPLSRKEQRQLENKLKRLRKMLPLATPAQQQTIQADIAVCEQMEKQHAIAQKINALLAKRQKQYIEELVQVSKTSGLLTYDVSPKTRQQFLATRNVVFSITKYGKEGMDSPRLDTVLLSSLFSSRNGLQQLLGRPTRNMPGKKLPVLLALVDDVGQCIGMAKKLMTHLRLWPKEEGGPYEPILIGFPTSWKTKVQLTIQALLGRS